MIHLNSDTDNTVVVTLFEKSLSEYSYYTWLLKDINSKEYIVFSADDNSTNKHYYNQFTFSVVSISPTQSAYGLTNGTIYANAGTFEYTVYEMQNQYDLNLIASYGAVEKGLLTINGTYSSVKVYDYDGGTVFVNKKLNN